MEKDADSCVITIIFSIIVDTFSLMGRCWGGGDGKLLRIETEL